MKWARGHETIVFNICLLQSYIMSDRRSALRWQRNYTLIQATKIEWKYFKQPKLSGDISIWLNFSRMSV